jgi:AraC-like DNA-binding protein
VATGPASASIATVSIALVRGMLGGAISRGHSAETLLHAAGIAPELLAVDNARVTTAQYIALFQLLIRRLGDEALGFLSRPAKRGSLQLLTRAALGSPDVGTALARICHGFFIIQDDLRFRVVREGGQAGLLLAFEHERPRPQFLHEFMLRMMWRLTAWLAGGSLKVRRFDFAYAAPAHLAAYADVFPAPLRFGCAQSGFWFDARHLARPFGRDEAALQRFVASWPASVIQPDRQREGVAARVRSHLSLQLSHAQPSWPGLPAVARALHMSESTLQRQLAQAGTSLQAIKDELRRDLAISRLASSAATPAELAEALGLSGAAAFQRAFKRWTGSTPGVYREQMRGRGERREPGER